MIAVCMHPASQYDGLVQEDQVLRLLQKAIILSFDMQYPSSLSIQTHLWSREQEVTEKHRYGWGGSRKEFHIKTKERQKNDVPGLLTH